VDAVQLLLEGTSVATLREAPHGRSILILVVPLPTSGLVIEVLVTEAAAALVLVVKIIALEVIIFVLEAVGVLLLEVICG